MNMKLKSLIAAIGLIASTTMALAAGFAWYRSYSLFDQISIRAGSERILVISSLNGDLRLSLCVGEQRAAVKSVKMRSKVMHMGTPIPNYQLELSGTPGYPGIVRNCYSLCGVEAYSGEYSGAHIVPLGDNRPIVDFHGLGIPYWLQMTVFVGFAFGLWRVRRHYIDAQRNAFPVVAPAEVAVEPARN